MSCELKTLASIADLPHIQEWFSLSQVDNWLGSVHYAMSPTSELFAVAHRSKLVLLSSRWDTDLQHSRFTVTWKGELYLEPGEEISSIICLPIIGFTTTTQSTPEWTCIAIGFTSGCVRFFTDSGQEIAVQQWHNEPVTDIRAQSGKRINEELHIFYASCVCIVQGSNLVQMLRNMKYTFQRNKSGSGSGAADGSAIEILPCRKWSYGGRSLAINDAVVVGPQKISTFDHLLTASMEGGFYANYKSAPPQNSLIMTVGQKPYTGFHWAKEGFTQPVLADVARAVARQIKSALPTWLTGSTPAAPDVPPPPQPSEPMTLRFGLCDLTRIGLAIWLSPDHQHAAVSDNLGRILLVDCYKGVAVRMWKGYREAQCGFVQVNEKLSSGDANDRRHAFFLVIFAPRRSCLDVWALQRGPKVASFSVSRTGHLVPNAHSLMGVSATSKVKYGIGGCVFVYPDGVLKEVLIPFHCALSDTNSGMAKDLHQLRRIKLCLRNSDPSDGPLMLDEVVGACASLQTDEIRLKCIETLVRNTKIQPHLLKECLTKLIESTSDSEVSPDNMELDDSALMPGIDEAASAHLQRQHVHSMALNYLGLVEFYIYLTDTPTADGITKSDCEPVKLSVSESELENLQKFIDLKVLENGQKNSSSGARVTFNDATKSSEFVDYLTIFDCTGGNRDGIDELDYSGVTIRKTKAKLLGVVGMQMFGQFLERGKSLDEFHVYARKSRISSLDLMHLFLMYWLERPFKYTNSADLIVDLARFTAVLQHICELSAASIQYDYNSINYWWQDVRETLLQSAHSLHALLAAMMCRTYATQFRQRQSSTEEGAVEACEEDLWEQVPQELAEWTLLIDKLDDVAALGAVLGTGLSHTNSVHSTLPVIPFEAPDSSLATIVSSGQGIISEMVAKWVISFGINPKAFLEESVVVEDAPPDDEALKAFQKHWQLLLEHFPFSLQTSVVLVHMCWDYFCHWSKNMSNLSYFEAALQCLASIQPADYALKHGICCMIWNAHLKIPLEAAKKLINKTGRLPKEALCLQDIGLSDSLVPDLLEHCTAFLEHFASSTKAPEFKLRHEELLQEGPVPLALLALQQDPAIADIVRVHIELNHVMFMISGLNLRVSKPIQMVFDAMTNQTFFADINRPLTYDLPGADLVLQRKRTEFLCVAISATMDLIREDLEHVYLDDHIVWMERVERLSNEWGLNNDELKKHQIVELYAHCWDDYAEEQLNSVIDSTSLGGLLLRISGRRLNLYTKNKPRLYAEVASVGPLVTDYLDTLHNSGDGLVHRGAPDISLERLIALSVKAFTCLADTNSREKRVAAQLFDACQRLKERQLEEKY